MNTIMRLALSSVASVVLSATGGLVQAADSDAYKSATDKIASDYKAAAAQCDANQGNIKKICVQQAKAERAHAESDAVAQFKNTPKDLSQARTAAAKADYDLASAKCAAVNGAERSSCMTTARATEKTALAEAKAGTATSNSGSSNAGASGSESCNQSDATEKAACLARSTADTTKKVIDDTVITAKIKADLVKDPDLKAMDVHVETVKGVVMLSGVVPTKEQADKAVQLARSVEGVSDVQSALKAKQ